MLTHSGLVLVFPGVICLSRRPPVFVPTVNGPTMKRTSLNPMQSDVAGNYLIIRRKLGKIVFASLYLS
jgi:hypothetical protein